MYEFQYWFWVLLESGQKYSKMEIGVLNQLGFFVADATDGTHDDEPDNDGRSGGLHGGGGDHDDFPAQPDVRGDAGGHRSRRRSPTDEPAIRAAAVQPRLRSTAASQLAFWGEPDQRWEASAQSAAAGSASRDRLVAEGQPAAAATTSGNVDNRTQR